MKISSTLHQYLFQNPNLRYEVRKRQYDGLFNVSRPLIDINADTGEHSITWETIAVLDSESAASNFIRQYFQKK